MDNTDPTAVIKIIGVGGAGNNAVNHMIQSQIQSAKFAAINTDKQALHMSRAEEKLQIGEKLTKGLGAGADPEKGKLAAEESKQEVEKLLDGVDLLFLTAGMGGGTGTGAAPVIAQMAKERNILTVAVVTKPFRFEGMVRMNNALKGIAELEKHVDTLLVIPNDKLLEVLDKNAPIVKAFQVADDVLKQGVKGISDLIAVPSLINLDFADVRTIMENRGLAHMGTGIGKGEGRARIAVEEAVKSKLLETTIQGAKGVILNVQGDSKLSLSEVDEAVDLVKSVLAIDANIIFGVGIDDKLNDEVQVTIVATGFSHDDDAIKTPVKHDEKEVAARRNEPLYPEKKAYTEEVKEEIEDDSAYSSTVTKGRYSVGKNPVPKFLQDLKNHNKN